MVHRDALALATKLRPYLHPERFFILLHCLNLLRKGENADFGHPEDLVVLTAATEPGHQRKIEHILAESRIREALHCWKDKELLQMIHLGGTGAKRHPNRQLLLSLAGGAVVLAAAALLYRRGRNNNK